MGGRGYIDQGEKKAAQYIRNEFKACGLQAFEKHPDFFQPFKIKINTFPDPVELKVNGLSLRPGIDFLIAPYSGPAKKEFGIKVEPQLTHGLASFQMKQAVVVVKDSSLLRKQQIELTAEPKLIKKYPTQNVLGFVPGTQHPDSFIFFVAHYDHLGKMGPDVYFPGANDNASGIAMLLSLAAHYAKNPSSYSVGFIAFGAEEAGLLGSQHYVKQPAIELDATRFVIDLDILGGGDEGITVVNGRKHTQAFAALESLNQKEAYLPQVKSRGPTQNSDHAPFDGKGVPAFFIYTLGGASHYHDIDDIPENLSLAGFEGVYQLLIDFVDWLD